MLSKSWADFIIYILLLFFCQCMWAGKWTPPICLLFGCMVFHPGVARFILPNIFHFHVTDLNFTSSRDLLMKDFVALETSQFPSKGGHQVKSNDNWFHNSVSRRRHIVSRTLPSELTLQWHSGIHAFFFANSTFPQVLSRPLWDSSC